MHKTSEEVQLILKKIVDKYDLEDISVRQRQLRTWKQLKIMWEGLQRTYWSEIAHDWRIWDDGVQNDDSQQAYYDKPINVFRAYLESIIAALSVTVPPITCYPDDADNPLDIQTAKAGNKASHLLDKHNDTQLKWLHALFTFCTEGMTACYLEKLSDKSYGEYEVKKYEDVTENHRYTKCPDCGFDLDDEVIDQLTPLIEEQEDKFDPSEEDVEVQDAIQNGEICPQCMKEVLPQIIEEPLTITRLVGITKEPKSRINFEVVGGLYVKVPNYARKQKDCPYLIYNYETNYVMTFDLFEKQFDKETIREQLRESVGPRTNYEEWARLSTQYNGEYPKDVVTVRKCWLRPESFNSLDDDEGDKLRKLYPNGVYVCFVNDVFASAVNENLDDVWTLTYNPLSDHIHFDPLGLLLVSVQELTNDLISLTIQTIEHGIPQTFADPGVLNFPAYKQLEATPGGVYEAQPKSGKSVGDAFYEVKTAQLSPQVLPFTEQLQNLGQLASGATPSIYGGAIDGSETASQYSMSKAQALQRLGNTWKTFTTWWKNIHGKAVPMYLKCIKEDERDVTRRKDGSFFNTYIRVAELEGKIGKIELEANEQLPVTWAQKRDLIMKLLEIANPQVLQVLAAPENLPMIREAIGLDDFEVPGENDRIRQYEEIKELLNGAPVPMMPPVDPMNPDMISPDGISGQEMEMPSVEINPDYDDHAIQFEIVRGWVLSEEGRIAKLENPEGYRNVLLHGKMHMELAAQEMQAEVDPGGINNPKPGEDTEVPVGDTQ